MHKTQTGNQVRTVKCFNVSFAITQKHRRSYKHQSRVLSFPKCSSVTAFSNVITIECVSHWKFDGVARDFRSSPFFQSTYYKKHRTEVKTPRE